MMNALISIFCATGFNSYLDAWTIPAAILLAIGIILVIVEMFMPGIGIAGITGGVLLLIAVIIQADTFIHAMITVGIVLIVLTLAAIVVFKSFKNGRISKTPIVLKDEIRNRAQNNNDMIGRKGVAVNDLRPSGFADFDGKRLDVVTQGDFIGKGESIVVIATEGAKIIVQEA